MPEVDSLPRPIQLCDERGIPFPERIETHVSSVFLDPAHVVKVKKALRFPFLDFRTLEQRERACEAEVVLNRRFAPDVYLDVVPLLPAEGGGLRVGDRAEWAARVEVAVRMRRLPDADRFDVRLAEGRLAPAHLEHLAEALVRVHAGADVDRSADGPGSTAVLGAHVEENLGSLREAGADALVEGGLERLADAHLRALDDAGDRLDARRERGCVRDGHGDLRLDHVYLDAEGTLRVLDGVEFDRAFRVADVTADVAFFAMDLRFRGERALAERFVARYVRDSADHEIYRLLELFVAYFAMVRAKVTLARAAQLGGDAREGARQMAAHLLRIASDAHRPAPVAPLLVAIGGAIASGKSTLARELGQRASMPVVESDRLRKQLLGVQPEHVLEGPAAYGAAMTERVYGELAERAEHVLASGRSVVVDATFRSRAHRDAIAAIAERQGAAFLFVACEAPREVLAERLRAREATASISDARVELLDSFLAGYEPVGHDEGERSVRIATSGPFDAALRELDAAVLARHTYPRASPVATEGHR